MLREWDAGKTLKRAGATPRFGPRPLGAPDFWFGFARHELWPLPFGAA